MTATSDRGIRHTQWDHFIIILVLFTLQRWDPELLSESREYRGREKRNNESGPGQLSATFRVSNQVLSNYRKPLQSRVTVI